MRFHVVTTMNRHGWQETGKRMVESFVQRWTSSARLTLYAEDFDPGRNDIDTRPMPQWVHEFTQKHKGIPVYNGATPRGYDYRFDLVKFSWKVAAMTDFGRELTDGVMIWLDADTYTHADVTEEWLDGLFPEPAYMAWLERQGSHPETGFVMFRCSVPYHGAMMESLRTVYVSGAVVNMRETHDAAVIHDLVMSKVAKGKIPAPISLSGDPNWHHPYVSGPLGQTMDHLKGPRKQEGSSRKRDLKRPRNEPYWVGLTR